MGQWLADTWRRNNFTLKLSRRTQRIRTPFLLPHSHSHSPIHQQHLVAAMLLHILLLLLLLLTFAPLALPLTTDGLTLIALRSAISLDPTHILSAWSPSDPTPCQWPGVTCSSLGRVTALSLPGRSLAGYLPSELSLLASLQTLDLSSNLLSGRLPSAITDLGSLSHLDLSSNRFNGSLPPALARLPNLTAGVLNLSFNLFSGQIPPEFGSLPVAVSLDLRGNDLSGQIPQVGSLLNQGPTAFAGNPDLCGFPLRNPCGSSSGQNPNSNTYTPDVAQPGDGVGQAAAAAGVGKRKGSVAASPAVMVVVVVGIVFAALVSVIVVQWQFRKSRGSGEGKKLGKGKGGEITAAAATTAEERREGRTGEIYVTTDDGFALELEELLRASAYVVGKSKSGIVYRVVVGRGSAVAVRRLSEGEEGEGEGDEWKKRRSFETEAMAIGRAIHPNVVRLRAYYYAPDEKLLIYDYIANGTLHSALHGNIAHQISIVSYFPVLYTRLIF